MRWPFQEKTDLEVQGHCGEEAGVDLRNQKGDQEQLQEVITHRQVSSRPSLCLKDTRSAIGRGSDLSCSGQKHTASWEDSGAAGRRGERGSRRPTRKCG